MPYPSIYLGHDVLWRVRDPISQWMMAPDPSTNHWELGIEMLKVHYRETSPLIKDQSQDPRVSGQVLWGPVIPAPMAITSLLLALYSILTIYCVLPCMSDA